MPSCKSIGVITFIALIAAFASACPGNGSGVCETGSLRHGGKICGLNEEGVLVQECRGGTWVDTKVCTGSAVCTNGTTQDGESGCGINGAGVLVQECVEGEWIDTASCSDPDVCVNATTRNGETVCGLNEEGVLVQDEANGWTQRCAPAPTSV